MKTDFIKKKFDELSDKGLKILFYLTIFVLPYQFRYFFHQESSYLGKFIIEYNSFYISSTEILIAILLLLEINFWLPRLINILHNKKIFFAFVTLIFLTLMNIAFSINQELAVHRYLHLFLWLIFVKYSFLRIKTKKESSTFFKIIVFSALFQSMIAILQYISQGSLGLHYLGESLVSPKVNGVAKINLENQKIIRAYGTFPHPNVLAAYLSMIVIILIDSCRKTLNNIYHDKTSISQNLLRSQYAYLFQLTIIITTVLATIALIFTFSRTALIIFIVGLLTFTIWKKIRYISIILLSIILILTLTNKKIVLSRLFEKNIKEQEVNKIDETKKIPSLREYYINYSKEIIREKPLMGVGAGNFVYWESKNNYYNLNPWNLQPVHNLYLYLVSELGLLYFCFIAFIVISYFLNRTKRQNINYFHYIFITFFFLGMTDHYFYSFSFGYAIIYIVIMTYNLKNRKEHKKLLSLSKK